MGRAPLGFPSSFAPRRYRRRTSRAGPGHRSTDLELRDHIKLILQSGSSLVACDRRRTVQPGRDSRARSSACSAYESDSAGPLADRRESEDRQAPRGRTVRAGVVPAFMPKQNSALVGNSGRQPTTRCVLSLANLRCGQLPRPETCSRVDAYFWNRRVEQPAASTRMLLLVAHLGGPDPVIRLARNREDAGSRRLSSATRRPLPGRLRIRASRAGGLALTASETAVGVGRSARIGSRKCCMPPLRATGAKRLDLGNARIVQQLLVQGRFNRDQRDLPLGVVMNAPAVALWQPRHPQVRVALAQELLALFEPDRLRDLVEDGVRLKGNIFLGVFVRAIDSSSYSTSALVFLARRVRGS